MTAEGPVVTLHTSGLLSKWGFGDGDAPDGWYDYLDERGIGYQEVKGWRELLPALVRRYVVPVLDQQVAVTEISTNHNPVRAVTVDGEDAERCWHEAEDLFTLTPEQVTVPMAEVLEMARLDAAVAP